MIESAQIRAMLQQVIAFQISLDEFDAWLTKASWNMQQDSDAESIRLVGAIEGRIAEFDHGHISARGLYREFEQMIGFVSIETNEPKVRVFSSGSVGEGQKLFNFHFEQSVDADKRFSLGFSSAPLLPALR